MMFHRQIHPSQVSELLGYNILLGSLSICWYHLDSLGSCGGVRSVKSMYSDPGSISTTKKKKKEEDEGWEKEGEKGGGVRAGEFRGRFFYRSSESLHLTGEENTY